MRKIHLLMMLFAVLPVATNASAQGFGIYEHGACTMARAGAAVAAPCDDGSAIFFNPAGIAFGTGHQLSAGGTIINPRGGFTPDSGTIGKLSNKYYPVPTFYYTGQMGKLAIGAGLFAPYGLTTDWPTTFEGRFLGYKTSVKGIYVQPTVAYKVNDNFAIGGGVDIVYASLELNQRLDLSSQMLTPTLSFAAIGVPKGTDFADVKLSGHDYNAGFHLGMQAKVTPEVSFGARYLSRQRFSVDNGTFNTTRILNPTLKTPIPLGPTIPAGTPLDAILAGQFASGGSLADNQAATTGIVFPDQFVAGTAFKVAETTTLLLDYQFVHWALFDKIVITRANSSTPTEMVENFKNSHGVRVGVEHQLNQEFALRGGFIAHGAAAPDETVTPLLPEGPRREFTVGLGAKMANGVRADFAYQYLLQSDRRGRTQVGANNGEYNFKSHLFGVTLGIGF